MGNFDNTTVEFPTKEQLHGLTMLLLTGVSENKLSANYVIYPSECFAPKINGHEKKIIDQYKLKHWPNYYLNALDRSACIL